MPTLQSVRQVYSNWWIEAYNSIAPNMSGIDLKKNSFLRVALLISMYFPPEPGGGAITALNRALILKKIGYTVYVLCGFPSYPAGKVTETTYRNKIFYVEKMENYTLIRLRLLPIKSRGYLRRFILFVNFNFLCLIWMPKILTICLNPELVYALAPILFSSIVGFIYSKATKSFFVYEVSAFWPEELIAFQTNFYSILVLVGKTLAKISYSLPDMLVVISDLASKYLSDNYKPQVPVYSLPIGVERSRYPARSKESSRKELIEKKILPAILYDKFIVLYAGIISRITKVDSLVYAAKKLKDDEKEVAFLVIGEGEERQRLQQIKLSEDLTNLFLLPFQEEFLVPYIIAAADVCVVPLSSQPIYETTVPTKFYDYLACCKPQIGICRGEVAKIINSNKIGLVVENGGADRLVEAVVTLKNSPSSIQLMTENSARVLQEFTLDNLAIKFNIVLKKCIILKKNRNLK